MPDQSPLAISPSVFVLELVSSGYFGEDIGPSFQAEGRAMLDAVLADLRAAPGVAIRTIDGDAECLPARVAEHTADATLIIAPEFDGLLERFCNAAAKPGVRSLNASGDAIRLCADKWMFFQHLSSRGIATIPSRLIDLNDAAPVFPCVLKPRDGAGSWLVRRVRSGDDWRQAVAAFHAADRTEALQQPLIPGDAYSIAAVMSPGRAPDMLPIARQRLSDDGQFRYLGGEVPADLPQATQARIQDDFAAIIDSIPGLNGYFGCDVIVPEQAPDRPLFVELNPRMTTSYLGYRTLCRDNLMERMLSRERFLPKLQWRGSMVRFDLDTI